MNKLIISNRQSINPTTERNPVMSSSKKSALIATFAALCCLIVTALPVAAATYNAAADFSASSNPNGVWSYGSLSLLTGFTLSTSNVASYSGSGLAGWLGNLDARPDGIPYILYNGTANPITLVNSTYQPGQLGLQSGLNGQYSDVRWTAPFSGSFSIAATFSGLSSAGDSSDVHILLNGTSIFDANVNGSPNPQSYSGTQALAAGAILDFISGTGSDGNPNEGNTGLAATIVAVPEPTTVSLVGMAFGSLLAFRLRKRTQGNGRPVQPSTKQVPSEPSYRKAALISSTATLLCLAALALPGTASAYSVAADFSASSNPNSTWSYGWSLGLGAAFTLDTTNTTAYSGTGLSGWLGAQHPDGIPYILHNGTANPITLSTTTYQPGQVAEQPGESNQYCIIRWTAPSSGAFTIGAAFSPLSSLGNSVDVHILLDGATIFAATLDGSSTNYTGLENVTAGDTIDFAIGNGGNGPEEDTTALSATIVPEPDALELVGMGFGCLLALRLWNRK